MIVIRGLSKAYGERFVLNNINIDIKPGGPTGFVGANGAGKTSLFAIICGFVAPSSGEISLWGSAPSDANVSGRVAILPQDAQMTKGVSAIEHLTFFARLQGAAKAEAKAQAAAALSQVGLAEMSLQTPESLSHGMVKRLAIAQALIGSPELVILDEPTAGLDPETANSIRQLINTIGQQSKLLISSHDLSDIEMLCDDIVVMNNGVVLEHSQVDSILARKNVVTIILVQPASDALEAILKKQFDACRIAFSADRRRLIILFGDVSELDIHIRLLEVLAKESVEFLNMARGDSIQSYISSLAL